MQFCWKYQFHQTFSLPLFLKACVYDGVKKFHLLIIVVDYFFLVVVADIRQIPYDKKQLIADY